MTLEELDMAAAAINQVELRSSEEKVLCPQCQTEGKKSKVTLYPGQTIPKMKFTDGYWNEDGDFIDFNEEIIVPSYTCCNEHTTPCKPKGRGLI